jgi:hypothetical protein
MTASQLAKQLHGKRAGKRWMCRCPTGLHSHGDRNRSLSVWESDDGWILLKCFTGCQRDEILAAMGLKVRDLALNDFNPNPEWEQRRKDKDRLKLLERQHGLAIMAQAVIPGERNYWREVERNIAVRGRALRSKLYPEEAARIRRNKEAQHLIKEYGFEELMNCLPSMNSLISTHGTGWDAKASSAESFAGER